MMIKIPIGNKEFRVFQFVREDGWGQLNAEETIQSATVTASDATTGEAITGMVSDVAPYNSTAVRYFIDPGGAEVVKRSRITLLFTVVTSNGQTLTDTLQMVII